MMLLILAGLSVCAQKIGNGGSPRFYRLLQNLLEHTPEQARLRSGQLGSPSRRMNLRAPQAFISVDVANAAQHSLIEKERLNMCWTGGYARCKLILRHQQRLGTERNQVCGKCF